MIKQLHILVAQMNFLAGDCTGNGKRIIAALKEARQTFNADVVVFPELAISGYTPKDLLLRPDFHLMVKNTLTEVIHGCHDICAIVGFPHQTSEGVYSAAAFIDNGTLRTVYHKQQLLSSGVLDEKRYFISGHQCSVVNIKGFTLGMAISSDLWIPTLASTYKKAGAQGIITISASPFHKETPSERYQWLQAQAKQADLPIIDVHGVGGQDDLVFDGGSLAMDGSGKVQYQGAFFQEECTVLTLEQSSHNAITLLASQQIPIPSQEALIYEALVTGVRDYVRKNGFSGALVGLSGGIDSALTLCIAAAALGKDNVEAILMPSQFTAPMSIEDAEQLANNLGVQHYCISIEPIFNAYKESLADKFSGLPFDVTEENLQSRCRGTLLMAISNKQGKLLLATGNKSEMAVGYATLYGDLCGAFAPLKDVVKTTVYRLAHFVNSASPLIPERTITRPPTAELAPDQKDEDSLPPYPVLDDILQRYVEQDQSIEHIVAAGHHREVVCDVIKKVERSEYKRQQAPPGIRITTRTFGEDRRYPLTSGFRKTIE